MQFASVRILYQFYDRPFDKEDGESSFKLHVKMYLAYFNSSARNITIHRDIYVHVWLKTGSFKLFVSIGIMGILALSLHRESTTTLSSEAPPIHQHCTCMLSTFNSIHTFFA